MFMLIFNYLNMKTLLFFFLFLLALPAHSQSLNKNLKTNITNEGMMYYIYDLKTKSICDDTQPLEYDFTYLDSRNDVAFTATCITTNITNIDSFYIAFPSGEKLACDVEKIYTERKSKWHTRFRVNFSYNFWLDMYKQDTPFEIILTCKNKKQIIFKDSMKTWKKNKKKLSLIQEMIDANRN